VEAAYKEILREAELTYPPGSKVEYATGLYTIIARAMEVAAGRPYLEIIDREVITPIGLSTLTPNDPRRAVPDRTVFYMPKPAGGGFEPGPRFDPSHKLAGAGFLTTAADVATFGAALLRREYLSDRMREALFTPVPLTTGEPGSHALGFTTGTHAGERTVHLPGGGIGISSWLFIHPERRMSIAIMGNLPSAPVGGRTHRLIADAFIGAAAQQGRGLGPYAHHQPRH
jgi:CubicO group peptidase (beta-lactamase class C family)